MLTSLNKTEKMFGQIILWYDNLKNYIQQRMQDIAPNLQVFDAIKQAFIRHLKRK
jgi:RNA processing factor Prp31